jgi:bile acid:Na+ symporter, BASS family
MRMPSPFRANDLLLIIVVLSSMTAGIIFPGFGSLFQDLPVYCLMSLFFLSYLSIELDTVWQTLKFQTGEILIFTVLKCIILPVIIYYAFNFLAPDYALSALLLTGISTGVVAPFISNLVKGNSSLVLVVVVITSILTPFTLPALIQIITVKHMEISLAGMIRMLAMVIFIPTLAVEALRRLTPDILPHIKRWQFPLSLFFFAVTNLGVFWRYSPLFRKEPGMIVVAFIVATVLCFIYCLSGILFFRKSTLENQMAGAVMMGNINNVLVIVFSSHFFGPVEPMVAAMYMIPFFGLVIPLRYYYKRKIIVE